MTDFGRDPESEHEGPVAVIGKEPVRSGPQRPGKRREDDLVAGARYLEEDPALLLQQDLAVVERPRQA